MAIADLVNISGSAVSVIGATCGCCHLRNKAVYSQCENSTACHHHTAQLAAIQYTILNQQPSDL